MKNIGIIGAGQLGQMLAQAGRSLDVAFVFVDPAENPPAASEGEVLKYAFDDAEGLAVLSQRCDCVTYEFENVPVSSITAIAGDVPVYPPAAALENAQDRLVEKNLFKKVGIPVGRFVAVDSADDLRSAAQQIGLPIVLKTRRFGYDGKGQTIVCNLSECTKAFDSLGGNNLIAEQWIPFDRELSVIGSRSVSGQVSIYPLSENVHAAGILRTSVAPAKAPGVVDAAHQYLSSLLLQLDYVGTLALELFEVDGELLANEFAPRVHNSGHWSIEGAVTSQFENHLRAVLDLPLGQTAMRGHAGMLNLIGEMPAAHDLPDHDGIYLHDYGKSPRPGRKLGHITVVAESAAKRDKMLDELAQIVSI